jgi:nitrate/nitrite transporter NarK
LGPLLAVVLLILFHLNIRSIFYLAIVPGLLAVFMILLVQERAVPVGAKSKIDVNLRHFPKPYWNYLLVTAWFGIGNSSTSFLILQTKGIGASFEATILIYAGFNLVAALISYPAGSLSDRWGRRRVLLLSFIIFFIAYLGFARAKSVPLIATLFVFYGLFQGIFRSVGKAFASDFVPERLRASGVGWLQHNRWFIRIGGKHCCWAALGPDRPCGRVLLRLNLCRSGQYWTACVGSRGTEQSPRGGGDDSKSSRPMRAALLFTSELAPGLAKIRQ